MTPRIVVADPEMLASRAADHICGRLAATIAERGEAHLALTGGSSSVRLYADLRREPWRGLVDWSRVVLWMGDDRYVATGDADSNAGAARRLLFEANEQGDESLPVAPRNIRFFPIDQARSKAEGIVWAARTYAVEVAASIPADPPVFDLILLGLGSDGHILSVFPGSAALAAGTPLVMPIPAPTHIEPHLPRLTLNPVIVQAARDVVLLAQGAGKAKIVAAVLTDAYDPERFPGQLATGPNATWFLDAAAAGGVAASPSA